MTILEFADEINKELVVRYYPNQDCRVSAHFDHCEVKDGTRLVGEFGESDNPEEALNDYAYNIQGKALVFNARSTCQRQEFTVPKLLKLLGE